MGLAGRVDLVHLVYLVCLVHLVGLVQPNKRDKPNKQNNGLLALANLFNSLLTAKGSFSRSQLTFDNCADRGQSFRRVGFKP